MTGGLHRLSGAGERCAMLTSGRAAAKIAAHDLMERTWGRKGSKVKP